MFIYMWKFEGGSSMPGLKNLGTRLMYHGGYRQEDRMRMDKLRTLHKALLYSLCPSVKANLLWSFHLLSILLDLPI